MPPSAGWTRPQAVEPGCIAAHIQLPVALRGARRPVTVKFAVGTDGSISLFHTLTAVPPALANAIRDAVHGCAWRARTAPDGTPARIWVILPLGFQSSR